MEIRLDIMGEAMTEREVATLSRSLRDALGRLPEADSVQPVLAPGPEGSKGLGEVLGSILVGLPGEAIAGLLGIVQAIASRPGQPPFTMKITRDATEVSFDPRKITPDQVAVLAERLRAPT